MTGDLSIREQAIRTVMALLVDSSSPATGGVFRSRMDQVSGLDLPCFCVLPGAEKVTDAGEFGDHGSVTRTLQIMVRAIIDAGCTGDAEEQPEALVDDAGLEPFYVFAIQQLTGLPATLGGLVDDFREISNKPVYKPNGRDLIALEMEFEATYATQRGDVTQRG